MRSTYIDTYVITVLKPLSFGLVCSTMPKSIVPAFAIRGSSGISLSYGPPTYELISAFKKDDSKACKCMLFSPYGEFFAWANGKKVTVLMTSDWSIVAEIDKPRVCALNFSPKGTYLMTWETFTTSNDGQPNMHVFKSATGELLQSFEQKRQIDWEPLWTSDEIFMSRIYKNDVLFYKVPNFANPEVRLANQRVHQYSLSPGTPPYNLLCYIPGKQGQPSLGKLFQYPKFDTAVVSKSFFQADKVDMQWNSKGNGVLLMTIVEVDKTGSSYYGKQTLNYVSTKGDTAIVQLSKDGPIHAVQWSPNSNDFCVIYGFMPAKATIFNSKCESIFDFGTGPRNSIYYNPMGNILLLGGFGNLPGNVEVWDMGAKKLINKTSAPDTTLLQWSPDGIHYMTATTAPRLRICNGFKVWHYTCSLLYERPWSQQEELWQVLWQNVPVDSYKAPQVNYKPVEGIATSSPHVSKEVYRPPGARGKECTFKLHDDEQPPSSAVGQSLSKNALKLKKKREAKKAAKAKAAEERDSDEGGSKSDRPDTADSGLKSHLDEFTSDDPVKMKKILRIKSKLLEIRRLKELQRSGNKLEINQEEKIKKEDQLIQEMRDLAL